MDIFIVLCALACVIGIFWCLYALFWPQKPKPQVVMKNNVAGGDMCGGDIFKGVTEKPTRLPDTITQLKTLREVKDTGPKPKVSDSKTTLKAYKAPRVTRDIPKTDTRYYPTSTIHSTPTHVDQGSSLVNDIAMAVVIHELFKDAVGDSTQSPSPAPQPTYQPEPEAEREETRRTYYEPPAPAPYESPGVSDFTSSSDSYSSSSYSSSSDSYGSSDSGSSSSWD